MQILRIVVTLSATLITLSRPLAGAEIRVTMPLGRKFYQTNERIDLSVVRTASENLPAGLLVLKLTGADESEMLFSFPARAVQLRGGKAEAVEHVRINGYLLRPGDYAAEISCDGVSTQVGFTVCSHIRKSTYKLIHWGGSRNNAMLQEGQEGLGFNLAMGETGELSIPSGQDVMGSCLMGGGHQHDLKLSNDWSNPNVYIGAIQRGLDRAFSFRTMPNAIGAHLHDEPGLTWLPHPRLKGPDGKPLLCAHDIPPQQAAFKRAFDREMPPFDSLDTKTAEGLAAWREVCEFKLGFMDAFWKASRHSLERIKPGYLPVTQSQYGWLAYHDGYYFNVVRSMPIVSGHGGYNDFWLRNFNPSFFLEMALPRQLNKPTWYLPEWWAISPDGFRLEHNLCFIVGIQGLAVPPGLNAKSEAAPVIAECNRLFARLGTIFERPAYSRQPLALLYSRSNVEYQHGNNEQPVALAMAYMATRLIQYPITAVLDEDVLDGTLAAGHKAILLVGIQYLDPAVVAALEAFARNGGTVLVTADCKISIKGAKNVGVHSTELWNKAEQTIKNLPKDNEDKLKAIRTKLYSFRSVIEYALPLAKALKITLETSGISPVFESSLDTVCAGRQQRGHIEYFFAVNFTPESGYGEKSNGYGIPIAAKSVISLPDDGRPIYDVIKGAPAGFARKGRKLMAEINFSPAQMIIFARTAKPIEGVDVQVPPLDCNFTRDDSPPVMFEVIATLKDSEENLLAGTAPLQITVRDPLGATRYDIYRATDGGVCRIELPLAVNDPRGEWKVAVTELISGKTGFTSFVYNPPLQCGCVAGLERRAVFFGPDKENIYRFFRNHRHVLVVPGTSEQSKAAADRLVAILKPYNVSVQIWPLEEASKARPISDEEAKTWCGTRAAGDLDANARNNPHIVGYNLPHPTVLVGNPQDNQLIRRLADTKVLPYTLGPDFPGAGRGMLAWNLMALGHDVETVVCIGNDPVGMEEAIGTLFTIAAGLDPLTPFMMPLYSEVKHAAKQTKF